MFTQNDVSIGDSIFTLRGKEYVVKRVYKRFVEVHRHDGKLTPSIRVNYGSIAEIGGFVTWERVIMNAVEELVTL